MGDKPDILRASGVKIAHLNVASILGAHKFEIDVFCASETWLNCNVPDGLIDIVGYNVSRVDRGWKIEASDENAKKGGGLICYTRQGIAMNEFRYARLNQSNKNLEMQWISLEMKNLRRIIIINIYRPPQGDYKVACKLINEAIGEADVKDNTEIFLLGDFNINFCDNKAPATKELKSTAALWGLKQLITGNTRLGFVEGQLRKSCIDNILTNSDLIADAEILDWNFSDHLLVVARRKKTAITRAKVEFKGRSSKNYVREELQNYLVNGDWDQFYASEDPSTCWDIIVARIRSYLDNACPQKMFRVREIREPWVSNEIIEEIKDKDRVLREAKKSGKREDWETAKRERNRVGRLVEQAKADFLVDQQEQFQDDPKKFWRLIKSIVPGKNKGHGKIALSSKEENGVEIEIKGDQIANFINDFFCDIGPKLAEKHVEPWHFYGEENENTCPQMSTDYEQVLKLCREIKTTKSSGIDNIASKVFKDAFMVLVQQLVYLFNLSFSSRMFPDSLKQATVIPLYKGGNKTDVSNYRPVSLLPLPGKLLERIAHAKLSNFLESHKVITDRQGGFRKGFSTASSVADLTDDLFENINSGLTSLAAFVDL